ncbi:calcium/proton exchanger [Colletotrichum gloeosporioides Cg-14]|uniref:Calcium/proton exchanger n=1 Tax=Colletotrichum gloeosporioides (strain Cg-14) TaxID=1237896 RepID=T0KQX4_COLGC|nr:calcium/proton exchanger [Colletotrichum gloeosporioides Cg-14]
MGALLNAISGNSVELIICLVALNDGRIEEIQAIVLGSILMNLLLVTGSSFFLGGIFNMCDQSGDGVEQNFASAMVQTARSFMIMSVAFLAFPASLDMMASKANLDVQYHAILTLSRGTAIIVLLLYFLYLFFQLRTHPDLFSTQISYEEDVDDYAVINVYTAAFLAVAAAFLTAVCANYFMSYTVYDILPPCSFGPSFLLIFPIPVISNAAELIRAIYLAIQNKMDLAMGIATGSCIQISLFTSPFLVIIAWAVFDQPFTLHFELFETMTLAFSVLVAYTAQEGRSNYLQGAMMIGFYSIIVLAYLVLPGDALDDCNT